MLHFINITFYKSYIKNYEGKLTNENYIYYQFHEEGILKKFIGFLRVIDFGLNIDEYLKSWTDNFKLTINHTVTFNKNEKTFKIVFSSEYNNNTYITSIHLDKECNFEFNSACSIGGVDYKYVSILSGNIFKYDGNYYIGKLNLTGRILNNICVVNDNILIENPYIRSISLQLSEILPFVNGEAKCYESCTGLIVDGLYVKEYTVNRNHSFFKITPSTIVSIIEEINNL